MGGTVRGILAAMVLALTAASATATHTSPPKKPERPPPQPSVQQEPMTQEPVKRQNFRARRADEIPPWEGFEDCPMAFPCVGAVNRY